MPPVETPPEPTTVVILAAGDGTRMRSQTPKVLHEVCGDTLLGHVLHATHALAPVATLVVVGSGAQDVRAALPQHATPVVQAERRGTGHAVRTALDAHHPRGTVLVVPGDAPLLGAETLAGLVAHHHTERAAATVLTARLADPTGYGRIVRDARGGVAAIVEERDADPATRALDEVAVSVYAFSAAVLTDALRRLGTANAQGEEYLTDVVGILRADGATVAAYPAADPDEVLGVNDRVQLAAVRRVLRDRLVRKAMLAGVTIVDPQTTWLDVAVTYEPDAVVEPHTQIRGASHLGRGCVVGPNATLTRTSVGAGASVHASTTFDTVVGPGATVGPYAYLRPHTELGAGAKVGAFVETKAADIRAGAKVPHLAYVGDALVGERSNIGCGTVFVNYDGVHKHRTEVGADVRIGANNSLVAPVTVGDGAYTGADAVIRHDVPPGALSYSANEQVTRAGWVRDNRSGTSPSAPHPPHATTDEGPAT